MDRVREIVRRCLPLILVGLLSTGVTIGVVMGFNKPVMPPAKVHKPVPAPKVLSSLGDCSSTILGDYSYRVATMVRNDGEDGQVIVEVTVSQGEESWAKRLPKSVRHNDVAEFVLIFDEVRFLRAHPTHSASVRCGD